MQNLVGSYTTYNALHRSCELWFRSGLSSPYPDACTLHAGNCACALADASFAALAVALLHVGCHLPLDLQLGSSCTMPYDRYCPPLSNIIALLLQHARLIHLQATPVSVETFYAVPGNLLSCLSSGFGCNQQACQKFTYRYQAMKAMLLNLGRELSCLHFCKRLLNVYFVTHGRLSRSAPFSSDKQPAK